MIRSFAATKAGVLIIMLAVLQASVLRGQTADSTTARSRPAPPSPVLSIGQPPIWRQQLSAQATAYTQDGRAGATLSYGVFHSFNKPPIEAFNPLLGVIGGTFEGYGSVAGLWDAGLRAMATSRLLATSLGADWDIRHGRLNTIVSWQSALRRSGILGHGSEVRVDWIPAREQTVRFGITVPTFQPLAGRTRPRATTVTLPNPPEPRTSTAPARDVTSQQLANDIAWASDVIAAYSNVYTDEAIRVAHASSYRAAMDRSRAQLVTATAASEQAKKFLDNYILQVRKRTAEAQQLVNEARAAKMQEQLSQTMASFQIGDDAGSFQEMREKIQRRSAAAEARMDLATGGVESKIQDIERESLNIQVEDTLLAYKRQMGLVPDAPSAPAPPALESDSVAGKSLGPSDKAKALE